MLREEFPRLAFSNSSPVRTTPRSAATARSLKCHFPGTRPNHDQLPTVDAGMPNSPASFFGPPNRDTISETSVIDATISRLWTFVNPKSGCPDYGCTGARLVDNAGMSAVAKKQPAKPRQPKSPKVKAEERLLRKQMGARLKEAREEAGYQTAEDLAKAIGKNAQTYRNYERGDAGITQKVMIALVQLGISIDYLYLGIGQKTIPEVLRRVA